MERQTKKLFLYRIPLLILQSAQTVVPIFFVRTILNELTIGRDIRKVIIYASAMALSAFFIKIVSYYFSMWDAREKEKLTFNMSKLLAESVMDMSYATTEDPEMQDYMWLARQNRFNNVTAFHRRSRVVSHHIQHRRGGVHPQSRDTGHNHCVCGDPLWHRPVSADASGALQ